MAGGEATIDNHRPWLGIPASFAAVFARLAASMKAPTCLILCMLVATVAGAASGQPAELADLEVRVDGNLVRLDFHLGGAFTPQFLEQLESGLPTGFIYRLELAKDRQWFDKGLDSTEYQVVAMYDAGSRGYLINYKLGGKLVESRMVRRIDDVEAAMTRIEDLPAFPLEGYPRSWRLLVRARVSANARVGFLVPDRPVTDWVESRKFRSLNELPDVP